MGKTLTIATPVCTALIELASAALGRDMRQGGRTVAALGEESIKMIINDARGARD